MISFSSNIKETHLKELAQSQSSNPLTELKIDNTSLIASKLINQQGLNYVIKMVVLKRQCDFYAVGVKIRALTYQISVNSA